MKKQITIKEEDIMKAFFEVAEKDEATRKLFEKEPLIMMTTGVLIAKIEGHLFEKTDSEEREEM